MTDSDGLVHASLTLVETLETVRVLWDPARYSVSRERQLRSPEVLGTERPDLLRSTGMAERFETDLFLDTTDRAPGPERDARALVLRLESWMTTVPESARPHQVVFVWGPFRFAGAIESLDEEWVRFDPDGTPVRAWVTLCLRR